jgi:hypothetical protein
MADTTYQIGVVFDSSAATTGLAQVNSAFQQTTNQVASMWTQTSSTITASLKTVTTEAENTAGRTKEQIEKASGAVSTLGDLIGVKVPEGITKMLAASETIGPMLEAAFAPLQIIAMIQFAVELADKIKTVAENLGGWTKEAKENYEALVQGNRQIIAFNERLADSKRRLNEIGHSGSALTRIQIDNDRAHREEIEKKIVAYGREAAALHNLLEGTHAATVADEYGQEVEVQIANSANLSSEEIEKLKKRLGELEGDAQHATGAIRELWEQAQQSKQVDETGKQKQLAVQQLQEYIASQQVRFSADKDLAEKRIELEQSVSRNQLLTGKITEEQAAAAETRALDDRYNLQTQYLTKLSNLLAKDPEHNKDRLIELKEQLKAVEIDHQKAILDLYNHTLEQKKELEKAFTAALEEQSKQQAENAAKEAQKAFDKIHKMVEEMKAVQEIQASSAKKHEDALKALALSRLDFERQIGNISESEYEKRLAAELEADYKKAKAKLLLDREAADGNKVEQARIDAELLQLDDKYHAEQQKAEQKAYLRRTKNIDAFFAHVKSAMDQSISGFLKGTESFSKAWQTMWSDMVVAMVQRLADMMLKWIQHHVTMLVVHATTKQAEVTTEAAAATEKNTIQATGHMKEMTRTAERAAGHAYDAVVGIPIVGPVLAPVAAGVAFAAVEAFGMMSAEGGQYLVPGPQLTMLHSQEMVLPAGLASRMRDVVDGRVGSDGGGGVTVVVNHSVNAMDAESFQGVIRRHGNIIGNEVARVLKKKGMSPR